MRISECSNGALYRVYAELLSSLSCLTLRRVQNIRFTLTRVHVPQEHCRTLDKCSKVVTLERFSMGHRNTFSSLNLKPHGARSATLEGDDSTVLLDR